jgi:hypothetical protein
LGLIVGEVFSSLLQLLLLVGGSTIEGTQGVLDALHGGTGLSALMCAL